MPLGYTLVLHTKMYWMHTRIEMNELQPELVASHVTVAGTHEPFVKDVTFQARAGEVTIVPIDPGDAQTALALALGGRIALRSGSISTGGHSSMRHLQECTRLVDVPDISSPDDAMTLHAVVGEELALADQPSRRGDVRDYLAARSLSDHRRARWDSLPATLRIQVLVDLGARRPGTRVLVITGPDRHGGDTHGWYAAAHEAAALGLTVIVLCAPATAAALRPATDTLTGALR